MLAGRSKEEEEEVVAVTSGGAETFSIRVLANTSARDPLVPLTSPWDSVEDADEEVDDPWIERLIQDSAFCKLCCKAAESAAWRLREPSSSEAEDVSGGVQASAGDWTNVDRLLVGMGKAIFCSLCFARAAWTASVWISDRYLSSLAPPERERWYLEGAEV